MFESNNKVTRCVIYTRKSTEEGLEQAFNSLDAQREACEAYIKSQAHEGWVLIPKQYDDGGFSGGNTNRPSLVQLMGDIESDEIDLIVVYKVDRLSRSLADFSNMVETFDKNKVSFVSITQQFNTSTSMGRLTLNVLLSFAQFEREVTGERIRDKVAASKKKGMWMGGGVPLGYDNIDKLLIVNELEAKTVRYIFEKYLSVGSVKLLKEKLNAEGIITKISKNGQGGNEFSRGALYALLKNVIYIGKIKHKEYVYDGNHKAILKQTLWDKVQQQLLDNKQATYQRTTAKEPALLAGLLFDDKGNQLSPTHTRKKNRRYKYYVNQALLQFKKTDENAVTRVPAENLEAIIEKQLLILLTNDSKLTRLITLYNLSAINHKTILKSAKQFSLQWIELESNQKIVFLNRFIKQIILTRTALSISYQTNHIINALLETDSFNNIEIYNDEINISIKRCGFETKFIVDSEELENNKPHPDSLKAIQKGVRQGLEWNQTLVLGEAGSAKEIAEKLNVSDRYVCQCIRLAYLSPDNIKRVFKGDIPFDMTLTKLKQGFPSDWGKQETLFIAS